MQTHRFKIASKFTISMREVQTRQLYRADKQTFNEPFFDFDYRLLNQNHLSIAKALKINQLQITTPRRFDQPKSFSNFLIKTMYPKPYLPAYFLIQILIFCLNKNSTLFVLSVQIDKGKQQTISLRVVHELIVIWYIFTCRVNYCYRLTFTRL